MDDELIRKYPSYMRADAVGLKAGDYVMKIVPLNNGKENTSAAIVSDKLTVNAHDRSGFTFFLSFSILCTFLCKFDMFYS